MAYHLNLSFPLRLGQGTPSLTMTFPREGITIDLIARATRKSLLNPIISTPAAFGIYYASYKQYPLWAWSPSLTMLVPTIYALAVISLALTLTDYLNKGANNNWVQTSRWNWNKEIVVITGGSSGIGASLAQQLCARNHLTTIIIIDYVPLAWVPPNGSSIHFFQCDLSDSSQIRPVCSKIRQEIGHPTILVNNAGISRGSTICDGPYSDVELTVRINLTAPCLLAKEFLPDMVRNDHGHIVNISSMSAFLPPSKVADYAATKAGLIALHEVCNSWLTFTIRPDILTRPSPFSWS